MDTTDDSQAPTVGAHATPKKTYRKPTVQIYGTLAEMTMNTPGNPGRLDTGGQTNQNRNRT